MADAILASGIYCITNTVNGKVYIGSAIRVKNRFRQHRSDLRLGRHGNEKLQRAWNKYGPQAFDLKVIEPVLFPEDLIAREQYWIDHLNSVASGYNILPQAGSRLGSVTSDESKAKMSLAKKGRPSGRGYAVRFGGVNYPTIDAAAAAHGRSCNWVRLRLPSSSETIQSPTSRPPMSDASKQKMSRDRRGKSRSLESVAKQVATIAAKASPP